MNANLTTNPMTEKEKVLVCITIQHNSKRLIKKGYEMAREINGELHILHIAKGDSIFTEAKNGSLLDGLFKYASQLGGEVHFECSNDVTQYIASFINDHHITCLVLGETLRNSLQKLFSKTIESSLESRISNLRIVVLERDTKLTTNTNKIIPT